MLCEHLRTLETAIASKGIRETYRGQAWSNNCREWVYYECYLDLAELRRTFVLAECVKDHVHRGTHDGSERGVECTEHWDAIMGSYEVMESWVVFPSTSGAKAHSPGAR
jgi:hypothetical protein